MTMKGKKVLDSNIRQYVDKAILNGYSDRKITKACENAGYNFSKTTIHAYRENYFEKGSSDQRDRSTLDIPTREL